MPCDARFAGQPHNLRRGHGDLFRGSPSIKFRPAGFRPWFGRSLHGLRDRVLPAVEVLRVRVARCWRSVRAPLADPPAPEYVLLP